MQKYKDTPFYLVNDPSHEYPVTAFVLGRNVDTYQLSFLSAFGMKPEEADGITCIMDVLLKLSKEAGNSFIYADHPGNSQWVQHVNSKNEELGITRLFLSDNKETLNLLADINRSEGTNHSLPSFLID